MKTLKDLLGDAMPIRVCNHCGKRAYNKQELFEFVWDAKAKYAHRNCCKQCYKIISNQPVPTSIVGSYSVLPDVTTTVTCTTCGVIRTIKEALEYHVYSNGKFSTTCKLCIGGYVDAFGTAIKLVNNAKGTPVEQIAQGEVIATYKSYTAAAKAIGGSAASIRLVALGIFNEYKGFQWKLKQEIS